MGDSLNWQHNGPAVEVLDKHPANRMDRATHRRWEARIADAQERLNIEQRARWAAENRKRYQGYEDEGKSGTNEISRKLERKCRATVGGLPAASAKFIEEDDEAAWKEVCEAFAADQMRTQQVDRKLRSLLWDNYVAGIGWARCDWASRFSAGTPVDPAQAKREAMTEERRIEAEYQQALGGQLPGVSPHDLHQLHVERHETHRQALAQLEQAYSGTPWQARARSALDLIDLHLADHRYATLRVDEEMVAFDRQPPFLVYYDPDAHSWERTEWYALESVERLETLKLNPELSRRSLGRLKGQPSLKSDPNHQAGDGTIGQEVADTSPAEYYVRYWIIHDVVDNQMVVIADTESEEQLPLMVAPWPYPGRIVAPLVLNPVDEQIHGVPEVRKLVRPHSRLEDIDRKIDSYITDVPACKVVMPKTVTSDPAFMKAWQNPKKLLCEAADDGLRDKVWEFKYPGIDAELVRRRQELSAELDSISGVSDLAQMESTKETATASAIKDRAMAGVIEQDQQAVAELVKWWLDQLLAIWREMGTTEQWVRIVGDDGREFQRMTPAEIPTGVFWTVDSDSFQPLAREVEQKREIELVQAVAPWMDPTPVLAARPFIARLLRKLGGPEDVSPMFLEPAVQLQQQLAAAQAIQSQQPAVAPTADQPADTTEPQAQPAASSGAPGALAGAAAAGV